MDQDAKIRDYVLKKQQQKERANILRQQRRNQRAASGASQSNKGYGGGGNARANQNPYAQPQQSRKVMGDPFGGDDEMLSHSGHSQLGGGGKAAWNNDFTGDAYDDAQSGYGQQQQQQRGGGGGGGNGGFIQNQNVNPNGGGRPRGNVQQSVKRHGNGQQGRFGRRTTLGARDRRRNSAQSQRQQFASSADHNQLDAVQPPQQQQAMRMERSQSSEAHGGGVGRSLGGRRQLSCQEAVYSADLGCL